MINTNSDMFDPIFYMSKNFIKARKYHSSIPLTYSDSDVIFKYETSSDCIKIYEIKGMSDILFQRIDTEQDDNKNLWN